MPDQAQPRKPRRFRLKLQFSLQTMLILMLVAALICAWRLTPRLEEKTLGGGALRIRGQWAVSDPAPANNTLPASSEPYLHGRWILYDRHGRKLVDGHYLDGEAAGPWRYFDTEGRETSSGIARRGDVDGLWTARHVGGLRSQQVSFVWYQFGDATALPAPPTGLNLTMWAPFPSTYGVAERTGTMHQRWDNGQPRVSGQFAKDRRAGQWTWFDREGRKIAEGTYRQGRKQGEWRRWETPGGSPVVEYFGAGQRVDDLDGLLASLAADMQSGQLQRRSRAAGQLERLGSDAVPVLRDILREGDCTQQLLAVRTLQHIGPEAAAAREELEAAAGDERPRVRLNALLALAETNPQRAKDVVDQLLSLATNDYCEYQDQAIGSLACIGPAGLRQLVAAVDDDRPKIRLAAFEAILWMENESQCGEPMGGDPNVDPRQLTEVIRAARDHPDPSIRELAGPPLPPAGGGFF